MKRVLLVLLPVVLLSLGPASTQATSTGASPGGYEPFTGAWHIHGFDLDVTSGGNAYATYRIYVWCSAHRHYACDSIIGNEIYEGGVWWARLANPGTVQVAGTIYASAESSLQGAHIVLRRQPQDFMTLTWQVHGQRHRLTLCGPHVPVPTNKCGA